MQLFKSRIKDELLEKRPLPVGVQEFHEWSDRIIAGACLTATPESQKFTLANLLINLPPTTAFETDLYFIHSLRKSAANQVADSIRQEIRETVKKRLQEQEQNKAAVTAPESVDAAEKANT